MFVTIRKYSNIKDIAEVNRRIVANLVPQLKGLPGFRSYITIDLGGGQVMTITEFESQKDADFATEQARNLAQEFWPLVPDPPEVITGVVMTEVLP